MVDLGGFYLDVIKDRLYTTPAAGQARRSAQTAMFHIAESMVRWLAPILSFTAEEIWRFLPGDACGVGVPRDLARAAARSRRDAIDWQALIELRTDVAARAREAARRRGASARRWMREVDVYCDPPEHSRALRHWARSCASC